METCRHPLESLMLEAGLIEENSALRLIWLASRANYFKRLIVKNKFIANISVAKVAETIRIVIEDFNQTEYTALSYYIYHYFFGTVNFYQTQATFYATDAGVKYHESLEVEKVFKVPRDIYIDLEVVFQNRHGKKAADLQTAEAPTDHADVEAWETDSLPNVDEHPDIPGITVHGSLMDEQEIVPELGGIEQSESPDEGVLQPVQSEIVDKDLLQSKIPDETQQRPARAADTSAINNGQTSFIKEHTYTPLLSTLSEHSETGETRESDREEMQATIATGRPYIEKLNICTHYSPEEWIAMRENYQNNLKFKRTNDPPAKKRFNLPIVFDILPNIKVFDAVRNEAVVPGNIQTEDQSMPEAEVSIESREEVGMEERDQLEEPRVNPTPTISISNLSQLPMGFLRGTNNRAQRLLTMSEETSKPPVPSSVDTHTSDLNDLSIQVPVLPADDDDPEPLPDACSSHFYHPEGKNGVFPCNQHFDPRRKENVLKLFYIKFMDNWPAPLPFSELSQYCAYDKRAMFFLFCQILELIVRSDGKLKLICPDKIFLHLETESPNNISPSTEEVNGRAGEELLILVPKKRRRF